MMDMNCIRTSVSAAVDECIDPNVGRKPQTGVARSARGPALLQPVRMSAGSLVPPSNRQAWGVPMWEGQEVDLATGERATFSESPLRSSRYSRPRFQGKLFDMRQGDDVAVVVVVGLAVEALTGAWWVDAVTSLGVVWFLVREGREAWNDKDCCNG